MPYRALRTGRCSQAGRAYFVTAVAQGRSPLFRDLCCARLVIREMRRLHDENLLHSLSWVLMPDHAHWLFELGVRQNLAYVMKLFKGRSAHALNRHLNRRGFVWQKAYHDHALRDGENLKEVARYIVANPLRKGLVDDIALYPYWDADWL